MTRALDEYTNAAPQGQEGQVPRIVPANLAATNASPASPTTPAVAAPTIDRVKNA